MIRLAQVRKSFAAAEGEAPLLEIGALRIEAGECVALLGASGSGKTTLLNLVSGLVLPDAGLVEVEGVAVNALSEPLRDRFRARTIGYVFQSFHLLEGFSALENVELGAAFTGRRVEPGRAKTLLEAVGLGHRLKHQPSQLSVGQQSRVAFARALVNRPKVLLADEPTGSLDRATGATVLALLLETARAEGVTLLCATHDAGVAAALDRSIVVEELS
ncbi:MAG TPA: ABC transporter ATP-binding protein [Planctomycetota bacterium]